MLTFSYILYFNSIEPQDGMICSTCRKHSPVLSSFMTYHRVCNQINTTGVTSGAGTAYTSVVPEFTTSFQWGSCYSIFSFICMFCRSLFVLLYLFFWPLCCLFFSQPEMMGTLLICISKMATPGCLQFSYDLYRRYHS